MTPQEIINEIQKLPPRDRRAIIDSVESGEWSEEAKPPMSEEEFNRILYAKGIIGNIPDPSRYTDEDDEWEPIEIKGRPTSEIIIEDRG